MKISAIIPVFNSVNTLERAINSLLIQPEINEVFIVDDGSTDGSFELAKKLDGKHSLVKVLAHEGNVNKGASASRNLGLKYCSNQWIQFLDADDELLPAKISKNLLVLNPSSSILVGNSVYEKDGIKYRRHYWINKALGLLVTRLGNTCGNLWNKESLMKIGGWNENLSSSQEYDLIFRLIQINPDISFCKDYLSIIHEIPGSITRKESLNKQRIINGLNLRQSIKEYLIKNNQFGLKERIFYNGIIGTISQKYNLNENYSKPYYLIFKIYKFVSDRFLNQEFSMN